MQINGVLIAEGHGVRSLNKISVFGREGQELKSRHNICYSCWQTSFAKIQTFC